MAKNHVAATLHLAEDTGIQLNGARGYSKDTVLEWIYRYARQARLVDGASEIHEMAPGLIRNRDKGFGCGFMFHNISYANQGCGLVHSNPKCDSLGNSMSYNGKVCDDGCLCPCQP
jgi:hypothetical protein